MSILKYVCLFCVFIGLVCSEESNVEEENVLVLNNSNFDQVINAHKYVLVKFYAAYCNHSKALAPEYAKAADLLKKEGSEIRLAKVDAVSDTVLGERFQILSFPMLKLFVDGIPIEYNSGRKAELIVQWLKKKTGPTYVVLSTIEELIKFQNDNQVGVLALLNNLENENMKIFNSISKAIDTVSFAVTTETTLFTELNVDSPEHIVLFKKFEEKRTDYFDEFSVDKIRKFILANELNLVTTFNRHNSAKIFRGDIKAVNFLYANRSSENFKEIMSEFKKSAIRFRGRVISVLVNSADKTTNPEVKILMELIGIKSKDEAPTVRLLAFSDLEMKKYKPDLAEISNQVLTEFLQEFFNDKLKPYRLGQELPADWDAKPVKVLTVKNFEQISKDKSKTVLVKFYAPWCSISQKLAPIYDKLAEEFNDLPEFIIAKIDATANEFENFEINRFPMLILYPKDSDEAIEYTGERNVLELSNFLKSNGKNQVESDETEKKEEIKQEL